MFLIEPQPTSYDLQFRVAGIPVRVHPLFWLMTLILGAQGRNGPTVLIWVAVVFVSIVVHELGHAFTTRYFGRPSRVVLYLMGGLTISEGPGWGRGGGRRDATREHILVSAAGPGAGFLLAGVVIALVFAAGSSISFYLARGWFPAWDLELRPPLSTNRYLAVALDDLLWVNIFWGLINLLPVFPLDGGQIARAALVSRDPWNGAAQALWISVFAGAGLALVGLLYMQSIFMAVFFGSLAASSYQALQQPGGGRPY